MGVEIPQPAMAWNQNAKDIVPYAMENSWLVEDDMSVDHLCSWSAKVFEGFRAKSGKERFFLVINAHGHYAINESGRQLPGYGIRIGKGIATVDDALKFEKLRGYLSDIVIISCGVAAVPYEGGLPSDVTLQASNGTFYYRKGSGDGALMLSTMAKAAGARVTAPYGVQQSVQTRKQPFGSVDQYQGPIRTWGSDGSAGKIIDLPPFKPGNL